MPVEPVIRGILDLVDEHAQSMPDQTYRSLADHLMNVSCSIEHKEKDAKKNLATQMIVEEPKCIGTGAVYKYTHDPEFMKLVVRSKALELQDYPRSCAAILGTEWKAKLAAALLEYDASPPMLLRVRLGVLSLLLARSQFLEQIVDRLDALKVTPQMLCPRDLGVARLDGDEGAGPGAREFLHHEPRLLRWLLGRDARSPWPVAGTADTQPHHELRLIRRANAEGGDDSRINAPCDCAVCKGVAIPVVFERDRVSLTPSEYDPSEEVRELQSPPVTRPTTPRSSPQRAVARAAAAGGPSPRRSPHRALARAIGLPYHRA
mgnify:CR=1 FL=1